MRGPVTFVEINGSGLFGDRFFYEIIGYRRPRKGEYYLSGAILEAYKAATDLPFEYTIVKKTARAVRKIIEIAEPL